MAYTPSFSQSGEDLIVNFIFNSLNINDFSYIDIGAYDPEFLSNTHLFYCMGCRGINIEPNPDRFQKFLNKRPMDVNLNIMVGKYDGQGEYYLMTADTLNTSSKKEAIRITNETEYKIIDTTFIEMSSLSSVIQKYCEGVFPEFLSLDIEGDEIDILEQIDFENSYPIVICLETINFHIDRRKQVKNTQLIRFIESVGYFLYADTFINSIFVKKEYLYGDKSFVQPTKSGHKKMNDDVCEMVLPASVEAKVNALETELDLLKKSKFWKIRNWYFQLKRNLKKILMYAPKTK